MEWMTIRGIWEETGIPKIDLYEAIHRGHLRALKDNGTRWLVTREDLQDWVERCHRFHPDRKWHMENPREKDRFIEERWSIIIGLCLGIRVHSREVWEEALGGLRERTRHILIRRFGLDGRHPATLEELAVEFGYSLERVMQIQREGERQLKEAVFVQSEN